MSTTNSPKTAPTTKRPEPECCTHPDCGSGLRNRYFFGKQLSPYSFQVEQRHLLERRRLLNSAIHGWGVVYGFEIKRTSSGSLMIKPGLALDKNGRELLQVKELTRAANELIVLDEKGQQRKWNEFSASECWLLSAHYAEQDTDAVKVSDPCQCEHMEWNYTCETIRFSLQSIDCAECCKDYECELHCKCASEGWCDKPDGAGRRGGRRCLCDYATELSPGSECNKLCEIDEPCGSARVDLHNGVPLACVKLVRDNCDGWAFGKVDTCGPRRLVKRNDLLFDLIQGCDLTKIVKFGWAKWHRQVDPPILFDDFSSAFGPKGNEQPEYITDDFWVEFSRPVREDTLQPDCFAMTIMASEREGGWWQTFRVPVVGVDTTLVPPQQNDPKDHVRSARIIVDGAWVEDSVRGRRTVFQDSETRIEIEVRGDFIVDCNGQAVDANAVGRSSGPTGNGTPGGTFLSTFRVAQVP
jgi:hypothetical protein